MRPDIGLIAQSCDELHHLAACDLTYEGGLRATILQVASGRAPASALRTEWETSTWTFPRGALRMRWLEEKEQDRAHRYYGGAALHQAAAAILLTLDGVPHLLMGQEFNEPNWHDWKSLFHEFVLDWSAFDQATFDHYRSLIGLRRRHDALRQGPVDFLDADAFDGVAYVRGSGGQRILVAVNLSQQAVALPALAHGWPPLYLHRAGDQAGMLGPLGCLIAHCPPA